MMRDHLGHFCSSRSFTLLETLVVVVLLAMVTSVSIIGLNATDQAAHTMAFIARCRELDVRGRLLAQTSGRQAILEHEGQALSLVAEEFDGSRSMICRARCPHWCWSQLQVERVVDRIHFDRLGHTPDYTIEVWSDQARTRIIVYGLTGVIRQEGGPR